MAAGRKPCYLLPGQGMRCKGHAGLSPGQGTEMGAVSWAGQSTERKAPDGFWTGSARGHLLSHVG